MRNLIIILFTGMIGLTLVYSSGCKSDYVLPEEIILPDTVSFNLDVIPIFQGSCLGSGCHGEGAIPPNLTPAKAYNAIINGGYINTGAPEQSELYLWMSLEGGRSMSTYSPNAANNAKVLKWIQEGAKNN